MWDAGQLGGHNPGALQFTVWYNFGKCFGFHGRDEHRQLKFGDINLKMDRKSGQEYLEYCVNSPKCDRAGNSYATRLYSTGDSYRDPVQLYKQYVERRPEETLEYESPFYLTVIPDNLLPKGPGPWYYNRPMGKNTLGQLMKKAALECGLEKKTNHSVRKTFVNTQKYYQILPQVTRHTSSQDNNSGFSDRDKEEYAYYMLPVPAPGLPQESSTETSSTGTTDQTGQSDANLTWMKYQS